MDKLLMTGRDWLLVWLFAFLPIETIVYKSMLIYMSSYQILRLET